MYVLRVIAGIPAKVKAWFKRFWLTLKKMFKPTSLTGKDIIQIIFEEFYRGIVPGMTAKEAAEAAEIISSEGIYFSLFALSVIFSFVFTIFARFITFIF